MKQIVVILLVSLVSCKFVKAQGLQVNLTKFETVCELAEASVQIISGLPPFQIKWSNGKTASEITDLEPGSYYVKITSADSHDTTVYFNIEQLLCQPEPSNHFTPNDDNFNDTWSISRIHKFPDFALFVYNRWGQQVHTQVGTYYPWDGTSFGMPLPDATYYYILYPDKSNRKKILKGEISILR
ncbi:MAG: hypothetical protein K0R26_1738 [Bacteroidota bacterium]|jgi:gliding motility-associated-like protein|nr:hypothetical protein [Bacteroidota bacterium]